jgi:hypothetical protein
MGELSRSGFARSSSRIARGSKTEEAAGNKTNVASDLWMDRAAFIEIAALLHALTPATFSSNKPVDIGFSCVGPSDCCDCVRNGPAVTEEGKAMRMTTATAIPGSAVRVTS